LIFANNDKKLISYIYAAAKDHLKTGGYAVEIYQNERLVARLPFAIQ